MAYELPSDLKPGEKVLVSACALGERTRYNGRGKADLALMAALRERRCEVIPVCPEVAGGLPTPRPPAEIKRGTPLDVFQSKQGVRICTVTAAPHYPKGWDFTKEFLRGAEAVMQVALEHGVRYAFFQERSPSCGVAQTHADGKLIDAPGLATVALQAMGVVVFAADGDREADLADEPAVDFADDASRRP